jgi:hypothetical protein
VNLATLGGYREGPWRRSIVGMNSQLTSLLVADQINGRIQAAEHHRLVRELRRARRDTRASVPKRRRFLGRAAARA